MFSSGRSLKTFAIEASVPRSASGVDSVIFLVAASAMPYSFTGSVRVDWSRSVRTSEERNTCWVEMRARSLPSPMP